MRKLLFLSLLFTTVLTDPIVDGPLGRITGKIQRILDVEIESFLGIPYAKPPTDELRFALPEPFGAVGDLEATEYGSECPQPNLGFSETASGGFEEDCLHLNVLRKKGTSSNDKKAVIAVIHGGGYIMGSSSASFMNAAALAAFGDVILVSFNYRLGILGFADMKDLAPGNLGLRDQRLALQWIQDHIAEFGGDPARVTAIGVSAGSMSLAAQIVTPIDSKNLFRAAVLDAGVFASNGFYEDSESSLTRVKKVAKQLGCPVEGKEMLNCLRKTKVDELVPLSFNITGRTGIEFFVATEDGEFVPRNVEEYVEKNSAKLHRVPIIIGYAKDEGTSFVHSSLMRADYPEPKTKEETIAHIEKVSASYNHPLDFTDGRVRDLISRFYVDKYPENPRRAVAELQGDGVFKCPINNFVRSYSRNNDDVYVYQFERRLRGTYKLVAPNSDELGVFHYSPYLHFSGLLLAGEDPVAPEDRIYFLDAIDLISSFSKKNQRPAFRGIEWPKFFESEEILILDDSPIKRKGLSSEENCREVFGGGHHTRAKNEL